MIKQNSVKFDTNIGAKYQRVYLICCHDPEIISFGVKRSNYPKSSIHFLADVEIGPTMTDDMHANVLQVLIAKLYNRA